MIQVDLQQLNGGVTGGEGICRFRSHHRSASKRFCSSLAAAWFVHIGIQDEIGMQCVLSLLLLSARLLWASAQAAAAALDSGCEDTG
eukprot:334274-Rhodomonas_salina.1